jgi:hypothetical protein
MELEDDLEEQGLDPQTILEKVAEFRRTLLGDEVVYSEGCIVFKKKLNSTIFSSVPDP